MPDARVTGNGLAACCCAALLQKAGFQVFVNAPARGASPILMLSDQTQRLLTDVFGSQLLFKGSVPISKRIVAWGKNSETIVLPHSGLVVNESALLDTLWQHLDVRNGDGHSPDCWHVISSKLAMPPVSHHVFGSRMAFTYLVTLKAKVTADACWVEATDDGWLFLLPTGDGGGSLISVGLDADSLLSKSSVISHQIQSLSATSASFPAYPRIVTPLCGPAWLGCGSAAVGFDPIAGEGAGNAVREGILASAVIQRAQSGGELDALLQHYSGRILRGFLKHLIECSRFYQSAGEGSWWKRELDPMLAGLPWVQSQISLHASEQFRLSDFLLQHRDS